MGYIIEQIKPNHIPIARLINCSHMISFEPKSSKFFFNKSKVIYNSDDFSKPMLITEGINYLLSNVCDIYRLILTKVDKLVPLSTEADVEIIELRLDRSVLKKNYDIILESLRSTIETEIALSNNNKRTYDVLCQMLNKKIVNKIKRENKIKIEIMDVENIEKLSKNFLLKEEINYKLIDPE